MRTIVKRRLRQPQYISWPLLNYRLIHQSSQTDNSRPVPLPPMQPSIPLVQLRNLIPTITYRQHLRMRMKLVLITLVLPSLSNLKVAVGELQLVLTSMNKLYDEPKARALSGSSPAARFPSDPSQNPIILTSLRSWRKTTWIISSALTLFPKLMISDVVH
jgi:hypothetical protein